MLSPDVKKEAANLWDIVSSSGLAPSPFVALEQIACLIFLKHLHVLDIKRLKAGMPQIAQRTSQHDESHPSGQLSWWEDLLAQKDTGNHLTMVTFPLLRTLENSLAILKEHSRPLELNGLMNDAYFQLDPTKTEALRRLINSIDALFSDPAFDKHSRHTQSELFEHLFLEASQNNKIGQVCTPPHIARFMVSLLAPAPNQTIIDPAVGTGTLLVSALHYLRESDPDIAESSDLLVGIDLDHIQTRISWVNLMLQGVKSPRCLQGDSLLEQSSEEPSGALLNKQYDFVLADIPFGGRVPAQSATTLPTKSKDTNRVELLFIIRALNLLKPGGRAALIVPQSFLSGEAEAQVNVRRELLRHHIIEAVILLPGKVFAPYTNNRAAVLVVRKSMDGNTPATLSNVTPQTHSVWFYEVSDDGISNTYHKNGTTKTENDFQDATIHFKHRKLDPDTWQTNKDFYFQLQDDTSPDSVFPQTTNTVKRNAKRIKQWQIPVRSWLEISDFISKDGRVFSSHDGTGRVRVEYEKQMTPMLYLSDTLDRTLLKKDCIEAQNWSLELSRYKPIEQPLSVDDQSVIELIDELELIEKNILFSLSELRKNLGNKI
ncbi:HsdM family class I SAM-dependent methyltransferase [Pseudomonas shahriarae]|uniref:HsdM family class I SAM-dependent methyltransferase n=1 Tax=Pseudomonas shahriarae TaxID=2745512 RepID=UPI00249BADCB|nr:N-6 DNA methylase [Pseudomonas shahriarae]MDI3206798.1 N-6 DNA methylase [Pseudomonas shahriarae]